MDRFWTSGGGESQTGNSGIMWQMSIKPVGVSRNSCSGVVGLLSVWPMIGMLSLVYYHFIVMAALRSRCGHYIFALWFLSIYRFFIPRLISAAAG